MLSEFDQFQDDSEKCRTMSTNVGVTSTKFGAIPMAFGHFERFSRLLVISTIDCKYALIWRWECVGVDVHLSKVASSGPG